MASIVTLAKELTDDKTRNDDGFSDRLSHLYTTTILLIFALVVSTSQYVGHPINCWTPVHFTDSHVAYTNDFCWVKDTYYLPFDEDVPREGEEWKQHTVVYYQWVPAILMVQAFLFHLPCVFWRSMAGKSGLDVRSIVEQARTISRLQMKEDIRGRLYQQMVILVNRYLSSCKLNPNTKFTLSLKHLFSRTCCLMCGRQRGNYLLSLYLFTKVFYLLNALAQLFALNALLDSGYRIYGLEALKALTGGHDWAITGLFPRVTMCDVRVRRLGNLHRYTVQCVLPVNLFNEKIYLFLWFWLVFVISATIISLLKWSMRAVIRVDRHRYVKRHLKLAGIMPDSDREKMRMVTFVETYLQQDGVFLIHLVDQATNTLTTLELTQHLWDCHKSKTGDTVTPKARASQS